MYLANSRSEKYISSMNFFYPHESGPKFVESHCIVKDGEKRIKEFYFSKKCIVYNHDFSHILR